MPIIPVKTSRYNALLFAENTQTLLLFKKQETKDVPIT